MTTASAYEYKEETTRF